MATHHRTAAIILALLVNADAAQSDRQKVACLPAGDGVSRWAADFVYRAACPSEQTAAQMELIADANPAADALAEMLSAIDVSDALERAMHTYAISNPPPHGCGATGDSRIGNIVAVERLEGFAMTIGSLLRLPEDPRTFTADLKLRSGVHPHGERRRAYAAFRAGQDAAVKAWNSLTEEQRRSIRASSERFTLEDRLKREIDDMRRCVE